MSKLETERYVGELHLLRQHRQSAHAIQFWLFICGLAGGILIGLVLLMVAGR